MAGLPKRLFYVRILPGGKAKPYNMKGGGKYTSESFATDHAKKLLEAGVRVKLFKSEMNWEEVPLEEKNPMEGMPGLW